MQRLVQHSSAFSAVSSFRLLPASSVNTFLSRDIFLSPTLFASKPVRQTLSRYPAKQRSREFSTSAVFFEAPLSSKLHEESKSINNESDVSKNDDSWKLPVDSWDTHFHIFDPAYPYAPSRTFTPPPAPRDSFEAFNTSLTLKKKPSARVLVQPSVYGTDNSLTFDFLEKERRKGREVRAIVVLDLENVSDKQLNVMHIEGVRGIRFNMASSGKSVSVSDLKEEILRVSRRLEGLGMLREWFLQLYIAGHLWEGLEDTIQNLPFRVIADHHGGMKGKSELPSETTTTTQPGFASLMRLAKSEKVFVKISAGYRASKLTEGGYDDLEELIKIFAKEIPKQLLWGSDWPHTGSAKERPSRGIEVIEPLRKVDNQAVLKNLKRWMGENAWTRMMVENPRMMFK